MRRQAHTRRGPRVSSLSSLVEHLEKTFPARCIRVGENMDTYKWYSAQHELALSLIRMIRGDDDGDPVQEEMERVL